MCVTNNVHHRNNPHHENLQSCLFFRRSFCFRYNNGKSRISRTAVHKVKKIISQLINHFHMLPNTALQYFFRQKKLLGKCAPKCVILVRDKYFIFCCKLLCKIVRIFWPGDTHLDYTDTVLFTVGTCANANQQRFKPVSNGTLSNFCLEVQTCFTFSQANLNTRGVMRT